MTTVDETVVGATADGHAHRKSIRASGRRQSPMATELRVRGFSFATDEPEAVGGANTAPTPMELIAGAVNGCISVVVETIADERGLRIIDIDTASTAHMDVRGFRGTAEVPVHFLDYALHVRVTSMASPTQGREIARDAEKRCPAVNLIRDAGVRLEIRWEFIAQED